MKFPINHDLHCHSRLSLCSGDPEMTTEAIFRHACEEGYDIQCVTNHFWDSAVPGADDYYRVQDLDYVKQSLPLPQSAGTRMVFGCETEFMGGDRLALVPRNYDQFDFIVIPPNHFNIIGLVRPAEFKTAEDIAGLFVSRLEEISQLDLPWKKVGIAHLTCPLTFHDGDAPAVFQRMDEQRLRQVFRRFAENGAGIELNANTLCVVADWKARREETLRLYRIARDAGCRFYCGSDAHHLKGLDIRCLREVADALELTEENRFMPA